MLERPAVVSRLHISPPSEKEALPYYATKESCVYTKCYCEENVYLLCQQMLRSSRALELVVCFVSNPSKQVPIWCQGEESDMPVVWDYHVILLARSAASGWWVYDLDTTLPFPSPFFTYAMQALRPQLALAPDFARRYRLVPGERFVAEFSSDRRHMLREDGSYLSPPPSYAPIGGGGRHNLDEYLDMESDSRGRVVSERTLFNRFLLTMR